MSIEKFAEKAGMFSQPRRRPAGHHEQGAGSTRRVGFALAVVPVVGCVGRRRRCGLIVRCCSRRRGSGPRRRHGHGWRSAYPTALAAGGSEYATGWGSMTLLKSHSYAP